MSSVQTNILLFTSGIVFATISYVGSLAVFSYMEKRQTKKTVKTYMNGFSYLFISDTLH